MNYKFSRAIAISLLFLGASVAHAQWTEPPLAPPSGNVSAPVRGSASSSVIPYFNASGVLTGSTLSSDGSSSSANSNFFVNGKLNVNDPSGGPCCAGYYTVSVNNNDGNQPTLQFHDSGISEGQMILQQDIGAGQRGFRFQSVQTSMGGRFTGNLIVDGNITTAGQNVCRQDGTNCPSSAGMGGSGTLNYVPKFTPNGTTLGNSQIFDNGTNVGIGTASPTEKLQVNGRVLVTGSAYTSNPVGPIFGQYNSSIGYIQAASGGDIEIWNGGTTAIASFKNSGNVGIGTGGPIYKLHATGDIYADGGWLRTSGSNGWYNNTHDGGFYMSDSTWIRTQSDDSIWAGNGNIGTNGCLTVGYGGAGCGGASAILAGNVGIGMTVPDAKLHIAADLGVYPNPPTTNVNSQFVVSGETNPGKRMILGVNTTTGKGFISVFDSTGGDRDLLLQPINGNVGIGTGDPNYKLVVNGGDLAVADGIFRSLRRTNFYLSLQTDRNMVLYDNGSAIWASGTGLSDINLKIDIKPLENTLTDLAKINPISFRWKPELDWGNEIQLGVIAQEIEKVYPQFVYLDKTGRKLVYYDKLVVPLIGAVKELKAENDELKARIEKLEEKIR